MPGKGTQLLTPLILQLLKNREVQLGAEALKNPSQNDQAIQFFRIQSTEEDFEPIIEWVGIFFLVFGLSLFSGSFLLVWIFALKLAGY